MLKGKAPIREGEVQSGQVINGFSLVNLPWLLSRELRPVDLLPQTRLGFTQREQEWEPSIASGPLRSCLYSICSIYRCAGCPILFKIPRRFFRSAMIMDHMGLRRTVFYPAGATAQAGNGTSQIVVDPWMGKQSMHPSCRTTKVTSSLPNLPTLGAHWILVIADATNSGTDKPILAVRGQDVYCIYNHSQTIWSANSHDGGATFTEVKVESKRLARLVTRWWRN